MKIREIFATVTGPAPQASVWRGRKCANSYPLKALTGGSYIHTYMYRNAGQPEGTGNEADI